MTETEEITNSSSVMARLEEIFPKASPYLLETLYYTGTYETVEDISAAVCSLKEQLEITEDTNSDDLLIKIMLLWQSAEAAKHKVSVLKSRSALNDISSALVLDDQYKNLLLNNYASEVSEKLFLEECSNLSSSFSVDELKKENPEFAKIIDTLIDTAQKSEPQNIVTARNNADYINNLLKEKKIPQSIAADLLDIYSIAGASDFKYGYDAIFEDLDDISEGSLHNSILAAKVMLCVITAQEAKEMAQLVKALPYSILPEDLQNIALKYLKLKTKEEISATFDAVLKRLPYASDQLENLSLAVRVITDARRQTLESAERAAASRRDKIFFMRQLSSNKFFSGYEDQLTAQFYGHSGIDEITSLFSHILSGLPNSGDINENADIGIKVLLRKLPVKDAMSQAIYRKENKLHYSSDLLEKEALGSYLGTKGKEEVLSFLRAKLNAYDFWKNDGAKHCYALSMLVGELNGNISSAVSDLALTMLEKEIPEESIEFISKDLGTGKEVNKESIISAYEKFYILSGNHKDAAKRVINMLQ